MEKLNYQNKTKQNKKRTSSTKQVVVGKGKHLLSIRGNRSMKQLRKHNWEYVWRHNNCNRHPLFAYIISHSSLSSLCCVLFSLLPPFLQLITCMRKRCLIYVENRRTLQSMSTQKYTVKIIWWSSTPSMPFKYFFQYIIDNSKCFLLLILDVSLCHEHFEAGSQV